MTRHVDVRGTRFAGALTTVFAAIVAVLAIAGVWWAAFPLAAVLLASAWGGPRWSLWGRIYRATLASRLAPPRPEQLEPERPPRFANLVGGAFLVAAGITSAFGLVVLGAVLAGIVAGLALVNATTGFCLGCRLYGTLVRDGHLAVFLGLR